MTDTKQDICKADMIGAIGMNDLISRQYAIDAVLGVIPYDEYWKEQVENAVFALPSAQPEVKPIGYQDCANAMLKMWMDNVLTDGEYNRIMDKLNKFDTERRTDG